MRRILDPKIKERYLSWYVTPPGQREPSSKQGFADEEGIHVRTLYNWEREEEFKAEAMKIRRDWGLALHGDILERLMDIVAVGKDSDSIAASRILLNHLDVGVEDAKKEAVDREGIVKALREAGFEVRTETNDSAR